MGLILLNLIKLLQQFRAREIFDEIFIFVIVA